MDGGSGTPRAYASAACGRTLRKLILMAYERTTVSIEKSQGEIRKLLYRHGATNMAFGESMDGDQASVAVEFVINESRVRMVVPVRIDHAEIAAQVRRAVSRSRDQITAEVTAQEARRIWRVLFHTIKARLVSVEEGVEAFEEAWLAHMVDPVTNLTMWDAVGPDVAAGALKIGDRGIMGAPLRELATRRLATRTEPDDGDDTVDAEVVE